MIIVIIQARMGSTRLPGKILKPILGKPMLALMLERIKKATKPNGMIVATTDKSKDNATANLAEKYGVKIFRGSEKDVLDRFYRTAQETNADTIVRLTGDCPLHDPHVIDEVIERFFSKQCDYTSTPQNYPEGLDAEVFSFRALEIAWKNGKLPSEREHVSPYIKNHPELFIIDEQWRRGIEDNSSMHWSVDTEADFNFVTKVFEKLYPKNQSFHKEDVLQLLREHPELLEINKGGTGYEGLEKSLREDEEFRKQNV